MKGETRPLRLLMTTDAVGGVWTYAITLAEALDALPEGDTEIVLAVLGPAPSEAQRARAAAVPNLRLVERPGPLEWMGSPWSEIDAAAGWLIELAAYVQPDLVHLNGYAHATAPWPAPVLVVGHSCVLSWWEAVHGTAAPPDWDEYRRRVAEGLAAADAVVAPTEAMLTALQRHYDLPRGGHVIANGCALERFLPQPKQELILAAGRLWDEAKNLGALDAAAARLSWPVHVAGETRHPERGAVAPRHAHTLGPLAAEALAEWMGRAAIYALPARYEPFGLSVLEAAAAGCALVLGDIPSLREIWGAAAEFVPPDDIEALAGALDGLIADDARRQRLGALAQRRAQAFSAERMAQSYAALYAELLTRRSSGAARFLVSAG